jgi:hypothetical protein
VKYKIKKNVISLQTNKGRKNHTYKIFGTNEHLIEFKEDISIKI